MKRNMDLVREILYNLEKRSADDTRTGLDVPGHSRLEVWHHLKVMEDAGLVEGVFFSSSSTGCKRMTWEGHEFIEKSRNDTIWNRAKEQVYQTTGGLSFEALKLALSKLMKDAIFPG